MKWARVIGLALTVALTLPDGAAAQQARRTPRVDPMTASIKGVITASDSGAPVRGAEIRVSSRSGSNRLVTTDGDGLYAVTDLPAGEYRLTASRSGFTSLVYGQRRPLEAPVAIDLAVGETYTANVALIRGGAIQGRLVDEFGEPIAGVGVHALRSRLLQGQRRLQSISAGDQTDDTGSFRLYGLPSGDYYVTASPGGQTDAVRRPPPIYYPGTPSFAEAQPITIGAGTEVSADFQITPIRTASVSGIVLNSSGAPARAMVQLASEVVGSGPSLDGGQTQPAFTLIADSRPDGTFTIENVPPGPYTLNAMLAFSPYAEGLVAAARNAEMTREQRLRAMENPAFQMRETASLPVTVSGENLSGVTVTTGRGATLKGMFVADSAVVQALPTTLRASVRQVRAGGGVSMMGSGRNSFQAAGMTGPFYIDVQGVPDGWTVRQISVEGADVTDEAIDLKRQTADARIVLTNRITTLAGIVQARRDPARHIVVAFPNDESRWAYPSRYVRAARADERGRFRIAGLPPNERYYAVAVDYLEDGEEHDPQLLERLRAHATTFSLGDGEQRTVYLDPVER
jgi:hypothetical protein